MTLYTQSNKRVGVAINNYPSLFFNKNQFPPGSGSRGGRSSSAKILLSGLSPDLDFVEVLELGSTISLWQAVKPKANNTAKIEIFTPLKFLNFVFSIRISFRILGCGRHYYLPKPL